MRKSAFVVVAGFAFLPALGQVLPSDIAPGTFASPTSLAPVPARNVQGFAGVEDVKNDVLAKPNTVRSLQALKPDSQRALRGAKSVQLYREISPSVVLVLTETGLGSGSVIGSTGEILTNWHVVRGAREVGVVFKPLSEGQKVTRADVVRGRVLRIDEIADLALVKVDSLPPNTRPLLLANATDIMVGSDVHAIGHPTGESWTYTMGVVSQIRRDYAWSSAETKKAHKATVIQTQTPINPGNSGGPLLSDTGQIVGVNSFKSEGEGLNFAVSVDEIKRFLNTKADRAAPPVPQKAAAACEIKELYNTDRNEQKITGLDVDCDGKVDVEIRLPYDKSKPMLAAIDSNDDKKPDILVFSFDRDFVWNLSLHDVDFDGKWDLVGHHPDGKIVATRFEAYSAYMARTSR